MVNACGSGPLAKAVSQSTSLLNVLPSSRASPLPQVLMVNSALVNTPKKCGSEQARSHIISSVSSGHFLRRLPITLCHQFAD